MGKALFIAALLSLLPGCATSPVSSATAERVTAQRFGVPAPGTAPLTITRDSGLSSSACATIVYVNGSRTVELWPGQTATVHPPAGDVIVGAQPGGICAGGLVESHAVLKSGGALRYRIGYDHNGAIGLYRTAMP